MRTRTGIVLFVLALTLVVLVGCSEKSIKEQNYSEAVAMKVIETDELSKEEITLFNDGVVNAKSQGIILEDKTVSDIIGLEKQRIEEEERKKKEEEELKRIEEEKRQAEIKRKQEEEERIKQEKLALLENTVVVTVLSKETEKKDADKWRFSDLIKFNFEYKNTSTEKDILGFSGMITFNDMFGDKIKRLQLKYDAAPIKADTAIKYSGFMEVNQFMDEDTKLSSTTLDKLQVVFEMDTILFTDGSTIKRSDIE